MGKGLQFVLLHTLYSMDILRQDIPSGELL